MRVLYFIGSYGPNVMGNASHEQTILALRERGHEVDVLTQWTGPGKPLYTYARYSGVSVYYVNLAPRPHNPKTASNPLHKTSASLRLRVAIALRPPSFLNQASRFTFRHLLQYEYLPTLITAYRKHLRTHHYDLVHVEGAYPFGFIAALNSLTPQHPTQDPKFRIQVPPYIANVQGADVIEEAQADYGYRRFRLPRAAVSLALNRAALVRSISPFLTDYLEKWHLAPRNRIVTVMRSIEESAFPPSGVTLQDFRAESRKALAIRHGIGLPRPVIMSLSRLHPFKGLEYLVDAIPVVLADCRSRDAEPPWFLICGPSRTTENFGDYRDFLQKRAEQRGVAAHVVFTGQVPHSEVRYHLAGADMLICPSIIEAQNKVVPEACAVGTPSVVTETTGVTSYLAPLNACVPVPPRSAQAIADAIIRLLREESLYADVQANARRAAETLRVRSLAPQLEAAWLQAAHP